MATAYKTPGVYVEEISVFPPSVAQVETAIPAFIGYTEMAIKNGEDLTDKPTRITSLLEYQTYFGGAESEVNISITVADKVNSAAPTTVLSRKSTITMGATSPFLMYYAMRMYFDNGGGPCYIVSVGDYTGGSVSKPDLTDGLNQVEKFDEPTLFVFPDAVSLSGGTAAANYYTLMNEALQQAQKLGDRFVIMDSFNDDASNVRAASTLGNGVDLLKYGAAYHPFLKTVYPYVYQAGDVSLTHTVTDEGDTVTDGDLNGETLDVLADNADPNFDLILYNDLKQLIADQTITLPPSPAMAGIYCRVDENRGVWLGSV